MTSHISLVTPPETGDAKKAEIVKMFLGPKVHTALSSDIKYGEEFWAPPKAIFDDLKIIFSAS